MKIWSTSNNWMEGSSTSDGIWGGTGDTEESNGNGTTLAGRQGACPDGYYIPSTKDWKDAYDSWYASFQSLSNTGIQLA